MGKFQLPLFGAVARKKRACFFSLHPRDKAKKFSAYAPKAMTHFATKYGLPVLEDPADLAAFDLVFFSLHCFRDFYLIARMAHHKRAGQEWIAGGNACATPAGVGWIMDYVWVGDCRESFARILDGEREIDGRPMGTPADAATRQARTEAHAAFDRVWRGGAKGARQRAYSWLAAKMGRGAVHIGEMTAEDCARVVALCDALRSEATQ